MSNERDIDREAEELEQEFMKGIRSEYKQFMNKQKDPEMRQLYCWPDKGLKDIWKITFIQWADMEYPKCPGCGKRSC